ncbi:hypothetical protein Tco_0315874 [Tanacetum coccineum]
MDKENMKEPVPRDLPHTPLLGHLKEQIGSPYSTRETIHMIRNPEEIHNAKAHREEGDMDRNMKEPVPRDLLTTPFLGHLKEQMGSPYKTRETVRMNENLMKIRYAELRMMEGI